MDTTFPITFIPSQVFEKVRLPQIDFYEVKIDIFTQNEKNWIYKVKIDIFYKYEQLQHEQVAGSQWATKCLVVSSFEVNISNSEEAGSDKYLFGQINLH